MDTPTHEERTAFQSPPKGRGLHAEEKMKKVRKVSSRLEAGFTLGELMIGLVIIAIIASVLAWNSTSLVRTYRGRQAVREIAGMLDFARARAIRTRRYHRVMLQTWTGNPFDNQRGRLVIQEGDSASVADAFGTTNNIAGQFDSTKPNNQPLWIVGDVALRRYGDVAITRLHRNGLVAAAQSVNCLWIYFSPSGSVCEPTPAPPTCDISSSSNYITHTNCYPAEHLACMRHNLQAASLRPHDSTYIRLLGSGQSRVSRADLDACVASPNNNPCCGVDP